MNLIKQKQKQEATLRNVEILKGLGLTENPMTQLASLVNTINASQSQGIQQDQFEREMDLRRYGQDQQWEESQANRALQALGLQQQADAQKNAVDHQDRMFNLDERKTVNEEGMRTWMQAHQEAQDKVAQQQHMQAIISALFGHNAMINRMTAPVNTDVLGQMAETNGLPAGLFAKMVNGTSGPDMSRPTLSQSQNGVTGFSNDDVMAALAGASGKGLKTN